MKTIVLDDDPTGTQSAAGVEVLLKVDVAAFVRALEASDSVYVLTNTRALSERDAVALLADIRRAAESACAQMEARVRFVLRGDSTLRGHVFAETAVFESVESVVVFVPAFPSGGRVTRGGVHFVRTAAGDELPAHETEYAKDPVFPFSTAVLVDYVAEKSGRRVVSVSLDDVRGGRLGQVVSSAAPGSVVVPDAVTNDDVRLIADALGRCDRADLVVRSGSPLAAMLAGVYNDGLIGYRSGPGRGLLVCGSHTDGATAQLSAVAALGFGQLTVPTDAALSADTSGIDDLAVVLREMVTARGLGVIVTERIRSAQHGTLAHGEQVMAALTSTVRSVLPEVDWAISKGGITSAETARTGFGAASATVQGQLLPGISLWALTGWDGRRRDLVIVPGNVGGPETLVDLLKAMGVSRPEDAPPPVDHGALAHPSGRSTEG